MANSVKTTSDWMSLFLGSSRSGGSSTGSGFSVSRYSSYAREAAASPGPERYTSSRYSSATSADRYSAVTSPTPARRSYAAPAYSSRYIPSSYRGHYSSNYSDDEDEDTARRHRRYRDRAEADHKESHSQHHTSDHSGHRESEPEVRRSKSKPQVTVLNEGAVIIRRQGPAETSDEDSEDEAEVEAVPEQVEPEPELPARDPLEVEEEMLNEKLQTAGFFLSMPEEEQIKKRLLEIKQMKDNPDWFREENTKNYKYSQVSGVVTAKPSTAKEEEEKILVLRLSSRGITEVEQTDVQVRLQEIWRDRKEEVTIGIGRMEQHYEHLLSEASTEIGELEGSIGHKYAAIARLQEELLVLSMRKDRVAADMEKVTATHQEKLEVLKKEVAELELKSSTYSVVRPKRVEESSLPESERSEIEAELECPVCLEISRPPIYQCPEGHLVCSACKPLLKACCQCDTKYTDPPIRCRFAEKLAARYFKDDEDK